MANTNVYLNLVDGSARLQNAQGLSIGAVTLEYNDTLTVTVGNGFTGTTSLTKVEIYKWENGRKSTLLGNWPDSSTIGVLQLVESGSDLVITDADDGAADGDYGYAVEARSVDGGKTTDYSVDPELLAKKKKGSSGSTTDAQRRRAPEADA